MRGGISRGKSCYKAYRIQILEFERFANYWFLDDF
jgi:hypothetical protein